MSYKDNFTMYGPYKKKDGRQIVIVIDRNNKRRTVSYPKWLMEVQLGRKLDPNLETVDHWDSDYNNNDISNLRLVPRDQHSADDTRRVKKVKLTCAWCDEKFERSPRIVRDKAKKNKAGPFCSRKCAGKYSRMLQLKLIKRFGPQKHVDSEYFKRKYVTASEIIWEDPINFMDLFSFASEDDEDYLYHETKEEYLPEIMAKGLLNTSYGQSFVTEHGDVMSPEEARNEIRLELEQDPELEDMSDEEFEELIDSTYEETFSKEDEKPRTYVHLKEPTNMAYGDVLLRFPKEDLSVHKDVDNFITGRVSPSKLEIKLDNHWQDLISEDE